eukprot:3730003-Lingulodinium_polyedra.AAC.1
MEARGTRFVTDSALAEILSRVDGPDAPSRTTIARLAERAAQEATPYGPCLQTMAINGLVWKYVNPM